MVEEYEILVYPVTPCDILAFVECLMIGPEKGVILNDVYPVTVSGQIRVHYNACGYVKISADLFHSFRPLWMEQEIVI